tara:strand:+ start:14047 stop:14355 length:309 start_codon:yes stop_codon:yes gene_type:complete
LFRQYDLGVYSLLDFSIFEQIVPKACGSPHTIRYRPATEKDEAVRSTNAKLVPVQIAIKLSEFGGWGQIWLFTFKRQEEVGEIIVRRRGNSREMISPTSSCR